MPFILGDKFIDALIEAGVVPSNCTQAIIHASVGDVTRVHYEVLGDDRLLEIVPAQAAKALVREYIQNADGEPVEVTSR